MSIQDIDVTITIPREKVRAIRSTLRWMRRRIERHQAASTYVFKPGSIDLDEIRLQHLVDLDEILSKVDGGATPDKIGESDELVE